MSDVLGVLDIANGGAAIRISFRAAVRPHGGALIPSPSTLPDPDARAALEQARDYVTDVIGWPKRHDVHWRVTGLAGGRLPPISGPSLFGAYCLGLMQLVAVAEPAAMLIGAPLDRAVLCAVRLDRVAASAAATPDGHGFTDVGKIRGKLAALGLVGPHGCALCVVCRAQPLLDHLPAIDPDSDCFMYATVLDHRIPVLKALDPVDAFQKLFALQTGAIAGLVTP